MWFSLSIIVEVKWPTGALCWLAQGRCLFEWTLTLHRKLNQKVGVCVPSCMRLHKILDTPIVFCSLLLLREYNAWYKLQLELPLTLLGQLASSIQFLGWQITSTWFLTISNMFLGLLVTDIKLFIWLLVSIRYVGWLVINKRLVGWLVVSTELLKWLIRFLIKLFRWPISRIKFFRWPITNIKFLRWLIKFGLWIELLLYMKCRLTTCIMGQSNVYPGLHGLGIQG